MNQHCHKFLAVTVLYRLSPSRSDTLSSLAVCVESGHDLHCVIWDNSPEPINEVEQCWLNERLPGFVYRHTPENVPLSRIYNSTIEEYFRSDKEPKFDALLLWDQDSRFGSNLLDQVAVAIVEHPEISLFLPLVVSRGKQISPADLYGCVGRQWRHKQIGRIRARFRTAINSGMIIRPEYLAKRFAGYDERLTFYGTDNYFCRKYAETERWIYVLDSVIHHNLARDIDEHVDVKLWRHKENVRANLVLNDGGWFSCCTSLLYCVLYCFKMAIVRKDIRFLNWQ